MSKFHIHIYFEEHCLEQAQLCFNKAVSSNLFSHLSIHEKPIGPHPLGMIEGHFAKNTIESVLDWAKSNRGNFSALIHLDTGDDFRDHTEGILWLGEIQPLNFDFFELIKKHPELRIHPIDLT